ncbi:pilin [Candidatus Gracilibacteria bacterium]|nr:pilin [Candidatus Gracilibacteria bacterium]
MKYIYISLALITSATTAFADEAENILGIEEGRLRRGDVHLDDIPRAIRAAIDFFMGIAGTIAVIFIIIGAYKILFGSIQQDKTKGKDTIIMALSGFALAALAWLIIKTIVANLT